jgi:division protein CdvB (Snf7/Vps24/ESCRT-III family)
MSYKRIMEVLKEKLTKDEWVSFGEELDGDSGDDLLDLVNEHLQQIAPEVFVDVHAVTKQEKAS